MTGTLAHVAFDIETTGLDATDEVTVVGFELELGCRVFNTTVGDEEPADLDTAYEILCAGDAGAVDPFEESGEAVAAFEDGRFEDVVLHNVADIRRPGQLSSLAQRYCSKSDFDLKSLTPTVRDAE